MQDPSPDRIAPVVLTAGILISCTGYFPHRIGKKQVLLPLPTLAAALAIMVLFSLPETRIGGIPLAIPVLGILLLLAIVQAGIVTGEPAFGTSRLPALMIAGLAGTGLLFLCILGGAKESRIDGPLPEFWYRFPVTGWLYDGIISLTGTGGIAYYSPAYGILIYSGLYIEIFIVALILFWVLGWRPRDTGTA